MSQAEILELLALKEWGRLDLAKELDLTENTVIKWLDGTRRPGGPAAVLMRIWLDEARAAKPDGKAGKKREKVGA